MSEDNDNEEEDYMSDAVLAHCTSKDVRPSLLYNHRDKRNHLLLKQKVKANERNKQKFKPLRVQEEEERSAGLQKPVGSDNKGFQMLSKMGYKPGTSLGKRCHDDSDRLKEPIALEVKGDRKGLGQKTKDRENLDSYKRRREDWDKLQDPEEFRLRTLASVNQKAAERDLRGAQTTCRQLDLQKEKTSPIESWYWPKLEKKIPPSDADEPSRTVVEIDDESDEDPELDIATMLSTITFDSNISIVFGVEQVMIAKMTCKRHVLEIQEMSISTNQSILKNNVDNIFRG